MSFANEFARIVTTAKADAQTVFDNTASTALDSIVHGSPITGAPGQPVARSGSRDDGKLRDSWELTRPDAQTAVISTDVDYAATVEENERGVHFHSGGAHSVKLTVAGITRIVEIEAQAAGEAGQGGGA